MMTFLSYLFAIVGGIGFGVACSERIRNWEAGRRGKVRVVSYRKPERAPRQKVADITQSREQA